MSRKNAKPATTDFNMTAAVDMGGAVSNTDALLGDLLDQLGDDGILETLETAGDDDMGDTSLVDEVIEAVGAIGEVGDDIIASAGDATDALLDEITDAADKNVAKQALYAEQAGQPVIGDATPPESDPEVVADAATGKGKKGGGRKKKATAEGEDPAAPKEPKTPRATSVTHKPGDLLLVKLGAKAPDFLTLRLSDAELNEEAMTQRRADFIARMNDSEAIADKVKEKMQMFLVWLTKGGDLNEVLKRALTVLHSQGELTSGDKGNLHLNLLSKPYSIGTARSQANQMFMAMPELGLTVKEKGKMVPNPDSALLPLAYSMLSLA
jgi:hypothetical protein